MSLSFVKIFFVVDVILKILNMMLTTLVCPPRWLAQALFEVVNLMICIWEIALFTYAKEIQKDYKILREKYVFAQVCHGAEFFCVNWVLEKDTLSVRESESLVLHDAAMCAA